jgi:hypothetical protein
MELVRFITEYSDEEKCKRLFKSYRDKVGVVCKKCGSREHYWQQSIGQYECKHCKFRTTLRSGTILEASKLPYRYWIMTMFLMSISKKGFSALEMQHMLGHKRYEPIWAMMHKIRAGMGNRESRYKLDGEVELDDAFLEVVKERTNEPISDKKEKMKRGRGSQRQAKVMVMAKIISDSETASLTGGKKGRSFRFVKMKVMETLGSKEIHKELKKSIDKEASIISDGWAGYEKLNTVVKDHQYCQIDSKLAGKILPWVHTMISNAKRSLLGTHHWVSDTYLQNYLNEYCYRTNRRYFGQKLWERLMVVAVEDTSYGKLIYVNG